MMPATQPYPAEVPVVRPRLMDADDIQGHVRVEAEKKLAAATVWLMRNEAFYSTLFLGLRQRPAGGTLGVTNDTFFFNPRYVMEDNHYALRFKLMHETLHVVFKHYDPRYLSEYSHDIRNQAFDYAINGFIVQAGERKRQKTGVWDQSYQMPEDGLYREEFVGMMPDEIAPLLVMEQESGCEDGEPCDEEGQGGDGTGRGDDDNDDDGNGGDGNNPGDDDDGNQGTGGSGGGSPDDEHEGGTGRWGEVFVADMGPEELDDINEEVNRRVAHAERTAKSRGQMPNDIQEAIDELRDPTPAWQEVMLERLRDNVPVDITFERPNRMFMQSPIVLPSVQKEGLGHIAILKDESGSVSDEEWAQFFADMMFIFEELHPERITVIPFDWNAGEPVTYEPGDEIPKIRKKCGGTRFSSAFDKLRDTGLDQDIEVAIVMTDGEDDQYPDYEPEYDVIWGTTGAFWSGDPPFGDIVAVKFE